ncbi:MAG: hypothetical protein JWO45_1349, partial [Spartobacteria bacterium]|nr:hypothetical protein [Spartobacteria bacterium]
MTNPGRLASLVRFRGMESRFEGFRRVGRIVFAAAILCLVTMGVSADAQQLKEARVTQIIKDVKLLPNQAAPRPAVVSDEVKEGTAVRTGVDSRTELTFSDLTITRLGANTVFSFKGGTRNINLTNGAILVQVPRNGAEVTVRTAAVSAAISGGTGIVESYNGKFMILEGIGKFWPNGHPEDFVIIHGGEMVWVTADGHISQPEKFNEKLVTETSLLIVDFPELPNWDLILQVIQQQVFGLGNSPLSSQKTSEDIISQRFDASPTPTPTPGETPTPTPTETP